MTCRFWIQTTILVDEQTEILFPHFINYYHQLLVSYKRFLILLHYDPSYGHRGSLERMLAVCEGFALECRSWVGPLAPDAVYEQKLQFLQDFIDAPHDWVINVDIDEFVIWESGLK